MEALRWLIFLTGVYPLFGAFRANRQTSLIHAVGWAALAWFGWGVSMALEGPAARYMGLSLIGCAGVAVLGARRPGVEAWNFVVAGLLAVLLLSLAEGLLTGAEVVLSPIRLIFLAGTLAVGVLNYLPTRQVITALLIAAGCTLELELLRSPESAKSNEWAAFADLALALVPWVAWLSARRQASLTEADRLWLDFRDRFGLVWGQRLREQFNRASANAGLPCELSWSGLRGASSFEAEAVSILRSLMKRFGPKETSVSG